MRKEGIVAMDWQPLCKVECPLLDSPPQLLFSDEMVHVVRNLGLDPAELCRIFREDERRRSRSRVENTTFIAI